MRTLACSPSLKLGNPHESVSSLTMPPQVYSGRSTLRLRLRDEFFRDGIDPRELLGPFDDVPGVLYFVKDLHFRMMAVSREAVSHLGFQHENEIIGRTDHEYLPLDLADKYRKDDGWVIRNQKPLRNIMEMSFSPQRGRDWNVTNKYPLRNPLGKMVGLIGTIQPFEARRKLLAHLGPVGKAADYIRDHLGDSILLSEIARHAGFSERQLQRLFRRVFGMTVQRFMIQSRIHASIHELINSERAIADIASRYGFGDQSAFTNRFRQVTGMPPRAYRDRHLARFSR